MNFNIVTIKMLTVFLLSIPLTKIKAQLGNVWAFGCHYGLDFNSGSPVYFDTTAINYVEGSTTICDSAGSLLFYSDGSTVYNKSHQIMPNGYDLAMGESTTQPGVIIPSGNNSIYYLFTTDTYINSSINLLKLHKIDMALEMGLGDVINKNQIIQDGVAEKITATRHCNGIDWWIITRKIYSNEYVSFLFSTTGEILDTIYSPTSVYSEFYEEKIAFGQMKVSPNGKYIASAYNSLGIEFARFDNQTGFIEVFGNDFVINWKSNYGISFSADSKNIYTSYEYIDSTTFLDKIIDNEIIYSRINSYSLNTDDIESVISSKIDLAQNDTAFNFTGLQLGPDKKIYARGGYRDTSYIPSWVREELFVIDELNQSVNSTGLIFTNQNIKNTYGLPTFPDAIYTNHHFARLKYLTCGVQDSLLFFDSLLTTTREYQWDFGDPLSEQNNYSNDQFPYHYYSEPGEYTITLTLASECNPIIITKLISIFEEISTPTILFENGILISSLAENYQWYFNDNIINGANNQTYIPQLNGNYTVSVYSNECTKISDLLIVNSVGINNISSSQPVTIYPNPANNILYLKGFTIEKSYIKIYDTVGRIMIESNSNSILNEIDISQLQNGTYIMSINEKVLSRFIILR
jgi:hypothetical protein